MCKVAIIFPRAPDKATIILANASQRVLLILLELFEKENIKLVYFQSRPSLTEKWSYDYFVELESYKQNQAVQKILEPLSAKSIDIKMLGSFSKAVL